MEFVNDDVSRLLLLCLLFTNGYHKSKPETCIIYVWVWFQCTYDTISSCVVRHWRLSYVVHIRRRRTYVTMWFVLLIHFKVSCAFIHDWITWRSFIILKLWMHTWRTRSQSPSVLSCQQPKEAGFSIVIRDEWRPISAPLLRIPAFGPSNSVRVE